MSTLDNGKLDYTGEFVIPGKVPYENWQEHINRYLCARRSGEIFTTIIAVAGKSL
jgi:hypothetical protein